MATPLQQSPAPAAATEARRHRSAAIDAVRVLAVAAVVIGHGRQDHLVTYFTFSWHVPAFFMLSGYLSNTKRNVTTEFRRRARTILFPTLMWGVIVTISWWIHGLATGDRLDGSFVHRLVWGGSHLGAPYTAFWFMPVMFASIVLWRLLRSVDPRLPIVVAVLGYVLCYTHQDAMATSFWSVLLAAPCMIFLEAGAALRTLRRWIRTPLTVGAALLGLAALALATGTHWVNIKIGSFGTPVLSVLVAIAVTAGLVLIAEGIFRPGTERLAASRLTIALAGASLPVVLGHMLVLSMWPKPWPWLQVLGTMAALWVVGLALARSRTASRYLL